jgi:HEAT repeats
VKPITIELPDDLALDTKLVDEITARVISACLSRAADESPSGLPAPFSQEEAERHYQALGRWKGPLAAKDVQAAAQAFWRGSGVEGARWLVRRLRDEFHVETLHWAGSTLARMGTVAIGPILEALQGDAPPDQAVAVLHALGWIGEHETTDHPLAELVLVKYLLHEDPDVRETACIALRLLPPERARTWLTRRLRDETDGEVRRTIEEELAAAQVSRG